MNEKYADNYGQLEKTHWWFLARSEILRKRAKEIRSKRGRNLRILNCGVASGATSEMLSEFGSVTSLEFDDSLFKKLQLEKPFLKSIQGSILELPFENNSFDLVCAFDVIEHVEDDHLAAKEMHRVLSDDGHVFISVPAFMLLWSDHDRINHHFRRYTQQSLNLVFSSFEDRYTTYFNTILFPPIAVLRILRERLFKRKNILEESDFGHPRNPLLNHILFRIFRLETTLIHYFKSLPFGVSLMLTGVKKPK